MASALGAGLLPASPPPVTPPLGSKWAWACDVTRAVVYDRLTLLPADFVQSGYHWNGFSVPMGHLEPLSGNNRRLKTSVDTNMMLCQQLPAPNSFIIDYVHLILDSMNHPGDDHLFCQGVGFALLIGQRIYSQAAMHAVSVSKSGTGLTRPSFDLVQAPLEIISLMCFHSEFCFADDFCPQSLFRITVMLEGWMSRGVQ